MLLKILREGLGRVIVFVSWLTLPKPIQRAAEDQQRADEKAKNLALYQFYACPFCVKTRRAIRRLNVPIEIRNATEGSLWRSELEEKGGKVQVPSLKITDNNGSERWLYESDDIIRYLEKEFT
ncbi:MAG TPA: glutaredoxin [Chromatiales bacterium]|nr:glutaredoxin [Thiotrichales bacterium]HIP69300.1 glutaredoxin [Chromatiales bacterium]